MTKAWFFVSEWTEELEEQLNKLDAEVLDDGFFIDERRLAELYAFLDSAGAVVVGKTIEVG